MTGRIDEIVAGLSDQLELKNAARDKALLDARRLTRQAALTIRALHRGDIAEAKSLLDDGRAMAAHIRQDLAPFPDIYWAGYVQDAQKEYAKASIVASLIAQDDPPGPEELGIEIGPYLNGLGEAASEMRRYVLDVIRHGTEADQHEGERVLELMDEIYTAMTTVDFPDALTGGLRRTTDLVRGVLERTRGDLTITLRQAELERALARR